MKRLLYLLLCAVLIGSAAPVAASTNTDSIKAALSKIETDISRIKTRISQLESLLSAPPPQPEEQQDKEGEPSFGGLEIDDGSLEAALDDFGEEGSTFQALELKDKEQGFDPSQTQGLAQGFAAAEDTFQQGQQGSAMNVGSAPQDGGFDLSEYLQNERANDAQSELAKQQALDQANLAEQGKWDEALKRAEDSRIQQEQMADQKTQQLKAEAAQQLAEWKEQVKGGAMSEAEFEQKMHDMQMEHEQALAEAEEQREEAMINALLDQQGGGPGGYNDVDTPSPYLPPPTPDWMKPGYDPYKNMQLPTPAGAQKMAPVTVSVSPTTMYIWDHGSEDGDKISISLNGQTVQGSATIGNSKTAVQLMLRQGPNQVLIKALNVGTQSPNTAAIKVMNVVEGNPQQSYNLLTGKTAVMTVTYDPGRGGKMGLLPAVPSTKPAVKRQVYEVYKSNFKPVSIKKRKPMSIKKAQ
ncbi:hypothetical protein [Desulfovibrio sp. JC010]|uniref:hypothetical protein n=1 Tax=Desulfovibrio sp. JC010 TaxID=2593641 RepID=UPI0013D716DF|nr:hypothetical protein [Desulfovibrio sp. JC010]NDV26035.1 hypothetical protein [Desulfovibrio sp. JC010]